MGLISNKGAKKKADELWSKLVKLRAKGKCEIETCGKDSTLNSHHIYSRANNSVRHDPENGACLCASHHKLNSKFSAHLAPADFMDWIREKRGEQWFKGLRQRAQTPLTNVDYKLVVLWLQQEIDKYEKEDFLLP